MRSVCAVLVAGCLLWGAEQARSTPARAEARDVSVSKMPKRWKMWVRIARCEQPGRGAFGVNWSHKGPRYQGGLGFYSGTWQAFRVKGYPMNAGYATWRQQMRVANRIFDRYGGSHPWGCG